MPTISTDLLDIFYEEGGPADGPVVLLAHGWPDDATTWVKVAALLNDAGLRTIAPYHRGFGATRFRETHARRTGNACMLALDMIALMNGLGVDRFAVAGHDWGSNIAEALAVGWPDRLERIAMLSTAPRLGGLQTPPFWHAQLLWYHWFQATARGAQQVREDRKGFAHIMWENWSPKGWFDEATFDAVARSFENPDWAEVTIHSYRSRWDEAEPDPDSQWLEDKVKQTRTLGLPTLYFQGEKDGVNPSPTSQKVAEKISGEFERIVLPGVGHFPTREAPEAVAARLTSFFKQA